ncbi:MAG: TRAP transporter substrate-binding protein [Hyphomicrobiaceae bacterium]|jgi:TRAP-type mannitol/chloroaromatic compound transport system substrate-binding protein
MTEKKPAMTTRRKFLAGAAVTGAATVAMPNVSRAETVTLKMQGAWGAQDMLNEMAQDFVKIVNELGEGRLKIDYLNAGAVVKPFSVMDGVHSGVLDGAHSVSAYWYGKHRAASLFGTGPCYGFTANQLLSWVYYGGGLELFNELIQDVLKLNVVGFLGFAMPAQPLGWFKREINGPEDLKGLKYRTVGLASNLFQAMGLSVAQLPGPEILPAMDRGVIEAFEFNNPSSDLRFGAQDVAKLYYLGSYHQAAEAFEILFNKTKFESLAKEQQAIIKHAVRAAAADNEWKAWHAYSEDLQKLINDHGVKVKRTPKSIFEAQLKAWDEVEAELVKDPQQGPFIKKVLDSQKAWAKRVGFYYLNNDADWRTAYEHHFGPLEKT